MENDKMLIQTADERRELERFPILKKAALMFEGQVLEATIFDISGGGAKIRVDGAIIPPEDKVNAVTALDVPGCGEIEARIVWKDEEYFGLKFDEDHSKLISVLAN